MRHISTTGRKSAAVTPLIALAATLVAATLGLAACGGSEHDPAQTPPRRTTNAAATGAHEHERHRDPPATTPALNGTSPRADPTRRASPRCATCLAKKGITLPRRTPRVGGQLGGSGAQLPRGMTRAQFAEALKSCGSGFAGNRFVEAGFPPPSRTPASIRCSSRFSACLRQNGINVGEPNTSGKGPIFNTKGINTGSPQFTRRRPQSAGARCSAPCHPKPPQGPPQPLAPPQPADGISCPRTGCGTEPTVGGSRLRVADRRRARRGGDRGLRQCGDASDQLAPLSLAETRLLSGQRRGRGGRIRGDGAAAVAGPRAKKSMWMWSHAVGSACGRGSFRVLHQAHDPVGHELAAEGEQRADRSVGDRPRALVSSDRDPVDRGDVHRRATAVRRGMSGDRVPNRGGVRGGGDRSSSRSGGTAARRRSAAGRCGRGTPAPRAHACQPLPPPRHGGRTSSSWMPGSESTARSSSPLDIGSTGSAVAPSSVPVLVEPFGCSAAPSCRQFASSGRGSIVPLSPAGRTAKRSCAAARARRCAEVSEHRALGDD